MGTVTPLYPRTHLGFDSCIGRDTGLRCRDADFLFELNDAVSGNDNDSSWQELFVEAISAFLLEDENSPGEIDSDEASWLFDKLNSDGQIDSVEKALLNNLKAKAKNLPENLSSL